MSEPQAIYQVEGDRVVPSSYAQGPWDPTAQHGGAVCGLLARELERVQTLVPMRFSRVTFDLMRSIPLAPIRLASRTLREGKKIQLVEASLFDGESEVARATGLRIRIAEGLDTGANRPVDEAPPFPVGEGRKPVLRSGPVPGFIHALDFIRADGEPDGASARTIWARFRVPVVAGEASSPFVLLAATCDFASGTGNALDFSRFVSINPDVSLHIERYPRSKWIALRGSTTLQTDGTGQSDAVMFDEQGRIAHVLTSLVISQGGRRG